MLHLLSTLFFAGCLIGAAILVARMIRRDAGAIVGALLRETITAQPARARTARVRQVAPMRPSSARIVSRRVAA